MMKKGMKQVCVSLAVVPLVWLNLGITQPLQVEVKAEETKEKRDYKKKQILKLPSNLVKKNMRN